MSKILSNGMTVDQYISYVGQQIVDEIDEYQRKESIDFYIRLASNNLWKSGLSEGEKANFWHEVAEYVKSYPSQYLRKSQSNQALMDMISATAASIEAISQRLSQSASQGSNQSSGSHSSQQNKK